MKELRIGHKKLKSDEFSALLIDARGLWPIAR